MIERILSIEDYDHRADLKLIAYAAKNITKKATVPSSGFLSLHWPLPDIFTFLAEPLSCYGNGFGRLCVLQAAPERNPFVESAAEIW